MYRAAAQNGHDPARADPRVPLLELVRARCHEAKRDRLYVGEITLDLNAKIIAIGGQLELNDRMVSPMRAIEIVASHLESTPRS